MALGKLARYTRVLNKLTVEPMGGHEYAVMPDKPFTIFVLPLRHENVEELADSITHEVIHFVHPSWRDEPDAPTDKVRDRTHALMAVPEWSAAVYRRLSQEYLRLARAVLSHEIKHVSSKGA